ncbi:MAG: hypothetical protein QOC81_981 [Thermoanaerobaculia bacterium]|jgi:hypothetical protein|nr:hypothetical protein [Thermoanaerobaculia bacterium]
MTTMTSPVTSGSAQQKHRAVPRIALVVVFWGIAALLVAVIHRVLASSPVASVAIEVIAIAAIAGIYVRVITPDTSLDHALFVGTTWTLLGIATEIFMTAGSGHQWFALLGSPANGGLRCVLLIAWIMAPALFVRSRE